MYSVIATPVPNRSSKSGSNANNAKYIHSNLESAIENSSKSVQREANEETHTMNTVVVSAATHIEDEIHFSSSRSSSNPSYPTSHVNATATLISPQKSRVHRPKENLHGSKSNATATPSSTKGVWKGGVNQRQKNHPISTFHNDHIQSPPKVFLKSSSRSPGRSLFGSNSNAIPSPPSSSIAAKPLILDIGDQSHNGTSIITTTISAMHSNPLSQSTQSHMNNTRQLNSSHHPLSKPASTIPNHPFDKNTNSSKTVTTSSSTTRDVETETDIITSKYSCMPLRLTLAKSFSESSSHLNCYNIRNRIDSGIVTPNTNSNNIASKQTTKQQLSQNHRLKSSSNSRKNTLDHPSNSKHGNHSEEGDHAENSNDQQHEDNDDEDDTTSIISLTTPENRWKAMSQMAGSHKQDATILDFSNRTDLTFESLQYGVPPAVAKNVLDLRCHEHGISKMAQRQEQQRQSSEHTIESNFLSSSTMHHQSMIHGSASFLYYKSQENRIMSFGQRFGSYEADLPAFLDVVERVFPNLLHISLGTQNADLVEGTEYDEYATEEGIEFNDDDDDEECASTVSEQALHHGRLPNMQDSKPIFPTTNTTATNDTNDTPISNEISPHTKKEAAEKEAMRMKRLYILFRLPDLVSINLEPVTEEERRMAHPNVPNGYKVPKEHWLTRAMKDWDDKEQLQQQKNDVFGVNGTVSNNKDGLTTWESSSSGGIECTFPLASINTMISKQEEGEEKYEKKSESSNFAAPIGKEFKNTSISFNRLLPSSRNKKSNTNYKADLLMRLNGGSSSNSQFSKKEKDNKLKTIVELNSKKEETSILNDNFSESKHKSHSNKAIMDKSIPSSFESDSKSNSGNPPRILNRTTRKEGTSDEHTANGTPMISPCTSSNNGPANAKRVINRRPPTSPASALRPIPLTKVHGKRSKKRNAGLSSTSSSSSNSSTSYNMWNRRPWGRSGQRRRPVMPSTSMADEEEDSSEDEDEERSSNQD